MTIEKQLIADETVAALTLDVPSGSHEHSLDGGLAKTLVGGAHAHVFILPNGEYLRTELGGEHSHDVYLRHPSELVFEAAFGGRHAHGVVLSSGTRLLTEDEGCHPGYTWDPDDSAPLPSGQHRHVLVLPSGLVLSSALPGDKLYELALEAMRAGELISMTKVLGDQPPSQYPPVDKCYGLDCDVSLVAKDGAIALCMDFEFAGRPVTLALNVARKGVQAESLDSVAAGFGPRGSRYTVDLHGAQLSAKLTKAGAGVARSRGAASLALEKCKIDCGYQSATVREFFLKGDKVRGRLVLEMDGDTAVAKFSTDLTPCIIELAAAGRAEVPPFGTSAMPASLACACPPDSMFWQEPDRELAKTKLAELAKSGFYSRDTTAFVDGEPHVVEREMLVRVYRAGGISRDEARKMTEPLLRLKAAVPGTWGPASEPGFDATHFVVEVGDGITVEDLAVAAAKVAPSDRAFLIETADTPVTREAFGSLGPMFKFAHTGSPLFVASFDPSVIDADAIEIIQPSPAEVLKRIEAGADPGYRRLLAKSADSAEERIAFGVVLEPGGVDAQNDTISAETIRTAAHKFMESFQNMGLQHRQLVNDRVKLLESYVSLCEMRVNGELVKEGTWLMLVRYDDDDLWAAVKSGRLTGFSIGGFARRTLQE